jgi:hypothetical protein
VFEDSHEQTAVSTLVPPRGRDLAFLRGWGDIQVPATNTPSKTRHKYNTQPVKQGTNNFTKIQQQIIVDTTQNIAWLQGRK